MKLAIQRASDEVTIYPSILSCLVGSHLFYPTKLFISIGNWGLKGFNEGFKVRW